MLFGFRTCAAAGRRLSIAPAVLGTALMLATVGTPVGAQTASEQLQKGIHAQETTGDLDTAIATYRQILGSGQTPRQIAATAQYRLAQTLLQKGDLDGAAREFQKLSGSYSEYKDLIAGLSARLGSTGAMPKLSKGTVLNGWYIHTVTGARFQVPPDGQGVADFDSSDGGEMVVFGLQNMVISVWMKNEDHAASELAGLVRTDLARTPLQGTPGWTVRPESIRTGGSGERQWLSAVADFTGGGRKLVNLMTWYRTTKVRLFFSGVVTIEELTKHQDRFNQTVTTAVVP